MSPLILKYLPKELIEELAIYCLEKFLFPAMDKAVQKTGTELDDVALNKIKPFLLASAKLIDGKL